MSLFPRKCRVTCTFFFFAVIATALMFDRSGMAAVALLAAALHECAHLTAMRLFHCMPERICFSAFGIDIVRPCRPDHGYLRDAVISFIGPLSNLAAAGLFALIPGDATERFVLANIFLFGFNILPIAPLDGGQALYALLCVGREPDAAARAVGIVSFLVLTPLAAVSFIGLFRSPGNFPLLITCIYLMSLLVLKRERYI